VNDRDFPWLGEDAYYPFPHPETADSQGIVAVGGNLSPGMLLSAYSQGIFPWFNPGEPIIWWSLDPRFVLYPENLHVSKSMKKFMKRKDITITMDRAFSEVIRGCKQSPRRGQDGTWITDEMEEAYLELHRLGYAHSVEVWLEKELAGGLYGVSMGKAFFGESMFARVSNASKAALIQLNRFLQRRGFDFIDCQQHTAHLESLGAVDVPRSRFLKDLDKALIPRTHKGSWSRSFGVPDYA